MKAGVGPVGLLLADAEAREPEQAKTIYCQYECLISALHLYTVYSFCSLAPESIE